MNVRTLCGILLVPHNIVTNVNNVIHMWKTLSCLYFYVMFFQ